MEKKYFRTCPSDGCCNIIGYIKITNKLNADKKKTKCHKCIRKERGAIYSKSLEVEIINKIISIYYDKTKTLTNISDECGVSFETLKKIIKLNNLPKIKRISKIINRDASYRKMFKTKYGIEYEDYLITKPIFDKYKTKVKYYTNKTVKKFSKYIENCDRVGVGEHDYHIDHMVSIKDCFLANIDPKITSDDTNLRAIPRGENLSKGCKSLFTPEMLLMNVTERNNNKINISDLWNLL